MKPHHAILRLISYLGPYWKPYSIVCILGLLGAILEMIPPKLVGQSIDLMSKNGFDLKPILIMTATWAAVALISQILHGFQIRFANHYGEKVLSELRERLFFQIQRLSMSYFDRTHPGTILSVHSGDVDAIRHVLIWGLNTIVANAAIMILAAAMIFHTDRYLFFATVWLFPALALLNFLYGKKITAAWDKVRQHSSLVGANQAENIVGIRVVHAFNRQTRNLNHYNDLQETNTSNNIDAAHKSGLFQPLLQWVRFTGVAIILILGGYRLARGELQAGSLVAVMLYWESFMNPAVNFGAFFNDLLIALTGATRLFDILDEEPDVKDTPKSIEMPPIEGHVEFENVSFRYNPNNRLILNNINFKTKPGSIVALVGETGSGKSTIISMLSRFYQPFVGRVLIDGQDIRYAAGKSLNQQMAMVLQANFLFSGTIMENLRYVRPNVTDEEIYQAARTLGCHDRFMEMKNNYHTDVGERGAGLSLGERQLVCFTRALVANPKILLLDEATSALDPLTGLQVHRAMHRLMKDRTTFIVTHRLSTVTNADLILMLGNGEILESGSHKELIAQNGPYSRLFKSSHSKASLR